MKIALLILILIVLLLSTILAVILSLAKGSGRIKYKFSVVPWGVFRNFPCWLPGSWGVLGDVFLIDAESDFVSTVNVTESVIYAWLWFRVEAKIINGYTFRGLEYPNNIGDTFDFERLKAELEDIKRITADNYDFERRQKRDLEENSKDIHQKSFSGIEGLIEYEELKNKLKDGKQL